MSLATTISAFTLLFLAELGDKSQLMALSLAHRYHAGPVLAGLCAAFLVLNILAVGVGAVLYELVPKVAIRVVAGVLFLAFGLYIWRAGGETEEVIEEVTATSAWRVVATSFGLIVITELGDKTQLALASMAAATGEPWAVLGGGTLALWVVSGLGVVVGATLLRRLPMAWVNRGAALLFFAFGGWTLARAVGAFA